MGRPSKHRLQTTASLRQRDIKLVKLSEDSDENGWHGQLQPASPSTHLMTDRRSNMAATATARLSADGLMRMRDEERLMIRTDEDRLMMMVKDEQADDINVSRMMTTTRRTRSFGSDASLSVVNSDSNCSLNELSPEPRPSHSDIRAHSDMTGCYGSSVAVKTEYLDVPTSSSSSSSHPVTASSKQYTVSWQGRRGSSNEQHVLSGGFCCELNSATAVTTPTLYVADNFCSSPAYAVNTTTSPAATAVTVEEMPLIHGAVCDELAATRTVQSPDDGVTLSSPQLTDMTQVIAR